MLQVTTMQQLMCECWGNKVQVRFDSDFPNSKYSIFEEL